MKRSRNFDGKRTALIVLGMHRSGTSAISGVLSLLGIAAPRSLMVPTPDNPKGYWESTALMTVHDKILRSAGSTWHDWGKFNPGWMDSPVSGQLTDQLAAVIESEFGDAPIFFVKDPRMCRLMPLWRAVLDRLGIDAKVVLQVRKPLEVSLSLQARNGFGSIRAQALWLRHVLEAEKGTRGMVRSLTTYDELMEDWRGLVARMGQELGLAWPRWSAKAEAEVDGFLAEDLRHNRRDDRDVRASGSPQDDWVQQAYDIVSGEESKETREQLDRIMCDFDASCRSYLPVVHEIEAGLEEERTALKAGLAESRKELEARVAEHERSDAELFTQIAELQAQIGALSGERRAAMDSVAEVDGRLKQSEARLAGLAEENRALGENNTSLAGHAKDLEKQAVAAAERISGLERQLAEERLQGEEVRKLLDASREEASSAHERHEDEMEALRSLKAVESDRFQSQIASMRASIEERFSETKKLTEMVFSLESRAEVLSSQLEAAHTRHRIDLAVSTAEVSDLKQRLEIAREVADLNAAALHGAIESQRSVIECFNEWGDAMLTGRSLRMARLLRGRVGQARIPAFARQEGEDDVEVIRRSAYFNGDWYLRTYEDVERRGMDPARHYLEYGAGEGRDPGPAFNTKGYLQRNPDVVASGQNPLVHYLRYGMQEARFAGRVATGS